MSFAAGQVLLGPRRLYQQLEELQHDLAVVQDVSLLVRTLQGTYQVTLLLEPEPDLCGGHGLTAWWMLSIATGQQEVPAPEGDT